MNRLYPLSTTALILILLAIAGCNDPTAPLVLKGSKIVVENQLLSPVAIMLNGIDMGIVESGTIRTIQRGNLTLATMEWELIRPVDNGRALGDTMSGVFTEPLPGDNDSIYFQIDHTLGEGRTGLVYFAPLITNTTAVPMEIGVNMERIGGEVRTGVIVQGGTQKRYIGYYAFGTNGNVRVYSPQSAYSPVSFLEKSYGTDYDEFDLDEGPGTLELLFDKEPP